MSTRVTPLSLSAIEQLPTHPRRCVFWEMDPAPEGHGRDFCDPEFEKEAWLSMVMLEWGSCAQVASFGDSDDKIAGVAFYAPPNMVPRARLFPTSPVSADAILLTTMRIEPHASDLDVGADLIRAVVTDLVRRNVRALEAFGFRRQEDDRPSAGYVPSTTSVRECSPAECMIGADFLEDMGFEVVAPHPRFPRLRLELDRDHGWKEEVEAALERLIEAASLTVEDVTGRTALAVP
ncbi:GNAT family N-acetyltransferase [Rhodococcus coprophilus]|uniref:N-acetyltransferase domain-containing protein n=1 Tax=Rhodococcus coprophilus TaxID=38310 RepID=A0A2X4XAP5_9NOCA|nr:hypothetical protein [Rhodococcus coprophilus]SQI33624.1 Uncharacterised protein [Rhodococcus coprophilus]